jgi:predicted nucleic acid-binding Zn ribbon protein
MRRPPRQPEGPAEAVRTQPEPTVVGSPEAPDRCLVCGKAMRQRKGKAVCGPACRRERSRRREVDARRARDHEVRMLLETALGKLAEGPS